ncbi:MAG: hypothetical protein WCT14_07090 [Treponemataceae bacterium]
MHRFLLTSTLVVLSFVPTGLFATPIVCEPKARVFNIEYPSASAGPGWIGSETDLVVDFPLSLCAVRAVLRDFRSYPRFFPRLVRTAVINGENEATTIRQRYEVAILGYRYPTEYDLALEIDETAYPERWVLSWNLAGSDGTIGESRGAWTLENVGTVEKPATRVTHRNRGLIKATFPLQDKIMRIFAQRELARSIMAVYTEAHMRTAKETELALAK